jgi:hypothetical protein
MSYLLTLTAIIEVPTGLGLLLVPSMVVLMLLGSTLETSAAITLGRVAGAALVALGMACLLSRSDTLSSAAQGLVIAMVIYNLGTVAILGAVGISSEPGGIALWPAVVLHSAMAIWCIADLMV